MGVRSRIRQVAGFVVGVSFLNRLLVYRNSLYHWFWPDEYTWTSDMDIDSPLARCAFQVGSDPSCNYALDTAKLGRCADGTSDCSAQSMVQFWRSSKFVSPSGTSLDFAWFPA